MKKIIALAVAAVVAAPAMADMTIGATVAAGYTNTSYEAPATPATSTAFATAADTDNGGFGIDTASVTIKGSETLENGLTISGAMGMGGLNRGTGTVDGENANLTVSGDFGSIAVNSGRGGSGISGVAGDAENLTGEVANYGAGDSDNEGVKLTLPAMGGVTFAINASETVGLGDGDDGRTLGYIASGKFGPVSVGADYYDFKSGGRTRINLGVDLGAAVVKLGHESRDNRGSEMAVGVTVPMGALSLGAAYATSETDATGDKDASGYSVGATYTLSDNVSVNAKYASWDAADGNDYTKSAVLMTLAF